MPLTHSAELTVAKAAQFSVSRQDIRVAVSAVAGLRAT